MGRNRGTPDSRLCNSVKAFEMALEASHFRKRSVEARKLDYLCQAKQPRQQGQKIR